MPNLQRFEGPDLEKLLDQVRSEAGPDAAIIEANKLRKGGVGGFFTKETFEVVVDLESRHRALGPGSPADAAPSTTSGTDDDRDGREDGGDDEEDDDTTFRPLSLMDLAERVSATERTANRRRPSGFSPPPGAPGADEAGATADGFAFNSVLESAVRKAAGAALGDPSPMAWDDGEPDDWHPGRLDQLGRDAAAATPGPLATATATDVSPANHLLPALAAMGDTTVLDPSPAEMAERLAGADRLRGAASLAARAAGLNGARPAATGGLTGGGMSLSGAGSDVDVADVTPASATAGDPAGLASVALARAGSGALDRPIAATAVPAAETEGRDLVVHQLCRVGIPSALLALSVNLARTEANVPAFTIHVELARILERLPRPPALPRTRGSVIAVVGPRKAGLRLARDLAQQLEVDPGAIVMAAPDADRDLDEDLVLRTAAEAADQRRSWARRKRPTVVVLDSPIGRRSPSWAAAVLDELEPAMTWGVVEAACKPEDVEAWAGALGGIDALELRRLDETTSPASVLHTGIPVAMLDGMTATTGRWVSVLSRHLTLAA